VDSREPQLLAGIVSDVRVINGQRGRLAIFKLDDKSAQMEATADEKLLQAHKDLFVDDQLIVVQAKLQPDRFSGGYRLQINKVWDLASARCRFGQFVSIQTSDLARTSQLLKSLAKDFPPQREITEQGEFFKGVNVRLSYQTPLASAQIQLGEAARFFPTDAALASLYAGTAPQQSQLVYT
jgi:DNA polymerase-3 subunit alpha